MRYSYVYILANSVNTVLYTGVTDDPIKRIWQHKNKLSDGFTSKYNVTKLVYFEVHENINEAIKREKQIKNWRRAWKVNLIREKNQKFEDLYETIL